MSGQVRVGGEMRWQPLTLTTGVALPALVRASKKKARSKKLRESCMLQVGESGVDFDDECRVRERVVLGSRWGRAQVFYTSSTCKYV